MKNIFTRFVLISLLAIFTTQLPVSALDTDLDTSTGSVSNSCVTLTYQMLQGSKDSRTNGEVSDLQLFLQVKGYLTAEPTGYFGAFTKAAVQNFQKDNTITSNGNVGPFTRAKIKAISCDGVNIATSSPGAGESSLNTVTTNTTTNEGVVFKDYSMTNGTTITSHKSTLKGAGPNLKGCTGPSSIWVVVSPAVSPCSTSGEFTLLTSQPGWSYDAQTDTYSINKDVSGSGWPATSYKNVYRLANGTQIERNWTPTYSSSAPTLTASVTNSITGSTPNAFTFTNSTTGNGKIIIRLKQTIAGAGAYLKACTGLLSGKVVVGPSVVPCSLDSSFVYLKDQRQENWQYNAMADIYSVDTDVSASGFPDSKYFTVFKNSSGVKAERQWWSTTYGTAQSVAPVAPVAQTPGPIVSSQNLCPDGSARRVTVTGPGDTGCGALPSGCPAIPSGSSWNPSSGTPKPCGLNLLTGPQSGTLFPGQVFIAPDSYEYQINYGGWVTQYSSENQMKVNNAENTARVNRLEMNRAFMSANNYSYLVFPIADAGLNAQYESWATQWKANHPGFYEYAQYTY